MVELYYGDQLGAKFILHHYIQQPTPDHEASQMGKITALHVSKQSCKGESLRVHKSISTGGKIKAEHLGQGHVVKSLPKAD